MSDKDPIKVNFQWGYIPEKCPHCGGNLFIEKEDDGKRVKKCLQCSRSWLWKSEPETKLPWVDGRKLK